MADAAAVETAIEALRTRVNAAEVPQGSVPERSIVCVVSDLGIAYRTHLRSGKMAEIEPVESGTAGDARLTAKSDDLIALLEGRLNVAAAFLMGRIRVDASPGDLLLIRKLF